MLSVGRLHSPFQVRIVGVGAFPSPARPRVFWLGVQGDSLPIFHAALEEELTKIGFPRDHRPFSPHLTLGRCRERHPAVHEVMERRRDADCGILQVDTIVLYESRLQPSGAVHVPRKTIYLGR